MATDASVGPEHRRHIVGASLTSAAGSLPTHLMPLTMTAVVAGTTTTVAEAGWVASALLVGQLLTSLGLPLLGASRVGRGASVLVSVGLLAGLALSDLELPGGLLAGWFLVGLCCGVLQFLGAIAAANYAAPARAFALRLGVVLVLAGALIALVQAAGALADYATYLLYLGVAFASVLTVGNALYAPPVATVQEAAGGGEVRLTPSMVAGLAACFVLFVGQTGLLAYVVLAAVDRGISLTEAAWAFAAVKASAGLWMVLSSRRGGSDPQRPRFLMFGALVAASGLAMSSTLDVLVFFAVLTVFEVAFNTLSARLQGAIAATGPKATGRWIAGTLLLGAACGPPLHGAAIGAGVDLAFIALAMASALLPAVWYAVVRARG